MDYEWSPSNFLVPPEIYSQDEGNERLFSDVPSDIIIEVDGGTFALHKFLLVSKSGRIRKIVTELNESDISRLELPNLPGGTESFELAAKFCYGINFEITPFNVAQLCCVSEYLEMTEEYAKENLSTRAEAYLDRVVCKSLEKSVEVLRRCENLLPLAEELRIITLCTDAIASIACTEQISSTFSRLEYSSSGRLQTNKLDRNYPRDWWIEDLSVLCLDMYEKVISALRYRGLHPESVGASLVKYTHEALTKQANLWTTPNQRRVDFIDSLKYEQMVLVETVTSLLPIEKLAVPIRFLFQLLQTAIMLECSIACRHELESRIASQLDMATLDDLLVPLFSRAGDALLDIDTLHRILMIFLQKNDSDAGIDGVSWCYSDGSCSPLHTAVFKVSKLVDGYLAEIAPDPNLKLPKFIAIAEVFPAHPRSSYDGLYRAIDIYLKSHPGMPDMERKKLCKLIDFQKLSPEACAHAAQNGRLPVESIIQVLYFEQLRLRNVLYAAVSDDEDSRSLHQSYRISSDPLSACTSPRGNYASLKRENRELKLELARMRLRLNELEKDHVCTKRGLERANPQKFLNSLSWKLGKLVPFANSSSTRSTSPSNLNRT